MDAKEFINKLTEDMESVSMHDEEKSKRIVEDLVKNAQFDAAWEDSPNATELQVSDGEIQECTVRIYDYFIENLEKNEMADVDLGYVSLFVPETVSPLISKRFNNEYTTESRDIMMENISSSFSDICSEPGKVTQIKGILTKRDVQRDIEMVNIDDSIWMPGNGRGFDVTINLLLEEDIN